MATLTSDLLIQLKRPSGYTPNPAGTIAFTTTSQYIQSTQSTIKSVQLLQIPRAGEEPSIKTKKALEEEDEWTAVDSTDATPDSDAGHTTVLTNLKYTATVWLDNSTLLFLRPAGAAAGSPDVVPDKSDKKAAKVLEGRLEAMEGDDGKAVEVWAKSVEGGAEEYKVGSLPTAVGDIKFLSTASGTGLLSFSASIYAPYDVASLYKVHKTKTEFDNKREGSTGQTYDQLFVRHWDEWKNQDGLQKRIFVAELENTKGKWGLKPDAVTAPMQKLSAETPVGPFGDEGDYDVANNAFVCTAKDPAANPAWHTRQNIYLVPLYPRNSDEAKPRAVTSGDQGATSSPVFSPKALRSTAATPSEGHLAWLQMAKDGYEADQNKLVVLDLKTRKKAVVDLKDWDRSPSAIVWDEDGDGVYLKAEDCGHVKLFHLPLALSSSATSLPGPHTPSPVALTHSHTISAISVLPSATITDGKNPAPAARRVLVTMSSFTSANAPLIITHSAPTHTKSSPAFKPVLSPLPSLLEKALDSLKLHSSESFNFPASDSRNVHGFLIRPPNYVSLRKQGKKLPLAYLIHGGPQGAWNDGWSWRWNAQMWAARGFIVAAVNPTGSTGYGQGFTDAINKNWGGAPYRDLVAGYKFLLDTYEEIDHTRTAALGASYGGYMVNWMMGHNPGFACFVCHDGVFSPLQAWFAGEELYFPEHDLGGTPYDSKAEYEKWNPQNHIDQWSKPCLVIHNRLDFRLAESEGVGVFNTLQRRGIPSRFLYFPDENHWVNKPSNSKRWHDEIFRWLDEWCSGDDDVKAKQKIEE